MAAQAQHFEEIRDAFNTVDDLQQFFNGNIRALVEAHGSNADKQLFRQSRIGLSKAIRTFSNTLTGELHNDPGEAARVFEDVIVTVDHLTDAVMSVVWHRVDLFRTASRDDVRRLVLEYITRQARYTSYDDGIEGKLSSRVAEIAVALTELCSSTFQASLTQLAKKVVPLYVNNTSSAVIIKTIRMELVDHRPINAPELGTLVFARFIHDLFTLVINRHLEEVTAS